MCVSLTVTVITETTVHFALSSPTTTVHHKILIVRGMFSTLKILHHDLVISSFLILIF